MNKQILIFANEGMFYEQIRSILEKVGYGITIVYKENHVLERLYSRYFDILLLELDYLNLDPIIFFKSVKEIDQQISVIFVARDASCAAVVNAIKSGVADYLQNPLDIKMIIKCLNKIQEERKIQRQTNFFPITVSKEPSFSGIIGKSPKMREVFGLIERVANTDSTVSIYGETGVGKELIARAIHFGSPRKDMPLIAINCGALTETLLESELFGHEKGSFTGALKTKAGKFECAHRGSLFLDEIGDISPTMQVKLLRALQEKKVERVGGTQTIDVDVRIIVATNQNLKEKISAHQFRIDLFYRINVIPIYVPPLRERLEDIPLLVRHFMVRLNKDLNRTIKGVTPRGMKQLMDHHWPGNVRELQNVLERAYIDSDNELLDRFSFSQYGGNFCGLTSLEPANPEIPFNIARSVVVKRFERDYFSEALRRYQGNISETAQKTGVNTRTLWRKISEFKLDRAAFKRTD